jgi:hypothetical protein
MKVMSNQLFEKPHTKLGWWSSWLGIAFVVMFIINVVVFSVGIGDTTIWHQMILPFYVASMLLCGLAGGVFGLIATIRQHERSSLVWLAILIGLFTLFIILNEFMQLMKFLQGA